MHPFSLVGYPLLKEMMMKVTDWIGCIYDLYLSLREELTMLLNLDR